MLLVRVVYNPNERDSSPYKNLQAHQAHQHFHLIYSLEKNVMIADNFFLKGRNPCKMRGD